MLRSYYCTTLLYIVSRISGAGERDWDTDLSPPLLPPCLAPPPPNDNLRALPKARSSAAED